MNATMSSALNIQFLMVSIAEMLQDVLLTITDVFAAEITKMSVKMTLCVCFTGGLFDGDHFDVIWS